MLVRIINLNVYALLHDSNFNSYLLLFSCLSVTVSEQQQRHFCLCWLKTVQTKDGGQFLSQSSGCTTPPTTNCSIPQLEQEGAMKEQQPKPAQFVIIMTTSYYNENIFYSSFELFGSGVLPTGLTYVVLPQLLDGELRLHQVVIENDDLSAQSSLLVVMVLGLTITRKDRSCIRQTQNLQTARYSSTQLCCYFFL